MTRDQAIERLRIWAQRAQAEANEADGGIDLLNWTGQAQVLSSVAEFLAGQGSQLDPAGIRLRNINGRQESLAAWGLARNNPRDLALHAGEVAAYDLALSLLTDAGEHWSA